MNDDPACWQWRVTADNREQVASCPDHFAHVLLWNWQRGRCASCGTSGSSSVRMARDHDHATGLLRGILCQRCNVMEGWAESTSRADFEVLSNGHGSVKRDFTRWREVNAANIARLDKYRRVNPASMLGLTVRHAATRPPAGITLPRTYHCELPIIDVPVNEWIRFRRKCALPGQTDRRLEVLQDFMRDCLDQRSVQLPE